MDKITRREFIERGTRAAVGVAAGGTGLLAASRRRTVRELDLLVRNGTVYDGSGAAGVLADVGVSGAEIAAVGRLEGARAKVVIDAVGKAVSPGFIDVHDHTAAELIVNPKAESAVRQGVTTIISGNCGVSVFPVTERTLADEAGSLKKEFGIELSWRDCEGFFAALGERGHALNYATLVGQGTLRAAAMGFNDRTPTAAELDLMKTLAVRAMEQGAVGLSTGLEYTPGSFATSAEIIDLARVVASSGGIYATHMRDEEDHVLEAIDEAVAIARGSGCPLEISHFKIGYPRNWPKLDLAIAKVDAAKRDGLDVFCDRYPYIASSTGLSQYFPMWAREGRIEDFVARLKDPALQDKLQAYVSEGEASLGSWDKVLLS
ncbi:MAG: amidohydrolase family protein, partial [Candidatus Aminicenantes bacterium]|nr:amidohydrolase family protein [Candidatus Aminicenantes bacterium]